MKTLYLFVCTVLATSLPSFANEALNLPGIDTELPIVRIDSEQIRVKNEDSVVNYILIRDKNSPKELTLTIERENAEAIPTLLKFNFEKAETVDPDHPRAYYLYVKRYRSPVVIYHHRRPIYHLAPLSAEHDEKITKIGDRFRIKRQ